MSSAIVYPAHPEQILKALGKVWTSLGYEEKQHNAPTVLRACAMTLIVATDEEDKGFSASQTIAELMREHPSRGIVIAVSAQAEHSIEARVLAQCWKPFGKAQQICCEEIEITTRPESWPNIGPTLVGLIPADLPVIFWCRHTAALSPAATRYQVAGLEAVMDLSTKVVVDTHGEDLSTALELISQWRAKGRVIADLQWARLTAWRQPIAQVFDNASREIPFAKFDTIEIGYTDEKPSARPFYVAGWLSSARKTKVSFKRTKGFGSGIHCITLRSESETIKFERTGPDTMTLSSTNGRERRYIYAEPSVYSLLNEELGITGPDPAFDAAFTRARELMNDYR
ncbi:MAG: glucose-6-phosphate dehydrogenase assembly protein OpcA [Acidobacteriaceae bacterium]|nr:glucose-6-phosphate dehydrogenase assembly protein OpcA [Acidobacteriaceae bacterium]